MTATPECTEQVLCGGLSPSRPQAMTEIWKPIPGHDGYEVSDHGRVRSIDRVIEQSSRYGTPIQRRLKGKLLTPRLCTECFEVTLGRGHTATVQSLVLFAFEGPPPPGYRAYHRSADFADNSLGNLEYRPHCGAN